jgi:hypothetical protein
LEAIVAPHVTTRKTSNAIRFKAKHGYVSESAQEDRLVWAAIFTLQCLYNLEDAISAGDIDGVIRWTYGFAHCDFDVMIIKQCGWDAGSAVALWKLDGMNARSRHQKHVNAGKKKAKFKDDQDRLLLRRAYDKNCGRRDWLRATTNELLSTPRFNSLSTAAVKDELRRLGIVQ